MTNDPLTYYAQPGPMTDVSAHADWLAELPTTLESLCELVHGLLLHPFWAEHYGVTLSDERRNLVNLRSADEMLSFLREADDSPLTVARPPEQRLVGICRDSTVLFTALLRHQGRAARERCGFATYFEDRPADHWVCEVWDTERGGWRPVDPQLDAFQQEALQLDFDVLDVPDNRFYVAGKAWQLCRAGQADPDTFGVLDMRGLWFVRGNLLRDLAALNKVPLMSWDSWGMSDRPDDALTGDDLALLDRIAALTQEGDDAFPEWRAVYDGDNRLRVPPTITSHFEGQTERVTLGV